MTIKDVLKKIEAAGKNGGMSPDDKIELSEQLTVLGDEIDDAGTKLRELPDLMKDPEGEQNPRDAFIDDMINQPSEAEVFAGEMKGMTAEEIAADYRKSQVVAVAKHLGLPSSGREIDVAERIEKKLAE